MAEEGFYTLFHLRDLNLIQTLLLICNKGLFELFHYHIDLVLIGIINIGKKNSLYLNKIEGVKFNPLKNKFRLSTDKSVNYIAEFYKN